MLQTKNWSYKRKKFLWSVKKKQKNLTTQSKRVKYKHSCLCIVSFPIGDLTLVLVVINFRWWAIPQTFSKCARMVQRHCLFETLLCAPESEIRSSWDQRSFKIHCDMTWTSWKSKQNCGLVLWPRAVFISFVILKIIGFYWIVFVKQNDIILH